MTDRSDTLFPSCVFWNMRFLSVTNSGSWYAKVENVNALVKSFSVVCLSETHVQDQGSADMLFFQHVKGARKFFGIGLAILVRDDLAVARNITADAVRHVIPETAMAISWEQDATTVWVLHFRLCADNENTRCRQLQQNMQ